MPELLTPTFAWLGDAPIEYRFYNDAYSIFYSDAAHSYTRYEADGTEVLIPGVTTVVKIIDKSASLVQWASNMACNFLRDEVEVNRVMGGSWTDMTDLKFDEWLSRAKYAHKAYKEAAGDTGHIAHDWIEQYIKASIAESDDRMVHHLTNYPEDERARNGCVASVDWMSKHKVRWVYTERKIYSLEHDFAGTLDGLAYVTSCGNAECCGEIVDDVRIPATFTEVLAVIDWKTSNALYPEYEFQTGAYTQAINEELGLGVEHRFIIRLGKDDAQFESRFLPPERLQDDVRIFLACLTLYRAVDARTAADRVVRDAVKAKAKVAKEAALAAVKAHIASFKAAVKSAKEASKNLYKELRKAKMTVEGATKMCDEALANDLCRINAEFGMFQDDEEIQDLAA